MRHISEQCPDGSMEMGIPEDLDEFFEVTTPFGNNPEELFEGEGIIVPRRDSIMITKIPAGLPFDVIVLRYIASGPTRVIIETNNGITVSNVSYKWY